MNEQNEQNQERHIELAKKHLAERTRAPLETIEVVEVAEVEWNDSSLGNPRPDMMYMQVITPGYSIELELGQKFYEYHTDMNGRVVLCNETPL